MNVAERQNRSTSMSMEAMELITCFYDGIDDVVREVAEELAFNRGSFLDDQPDIVAIEEEDVRTAGEMVLEAIRKMLSERNIPVDIQSAMRDMGDCFQGK